MGRSKMRFVWLVILMLGQIASAERILTESQLESLIQKLTENPRRTWLTQGSLKVVHTYYQAPAVLDEQEILSMIAEKTDDYNNNPEKAQKSAFLQAKFLEAIPFNVRYDHQNESTTVTTEYIKVDGARFYHESCIDSHQDTITPTHLQAENHLVNQLNVETNKRKIYSYDGKRNAKYIKSANFALLEDSLGVPKLPKALRAGLIHWGEGIFVPETIQSSDPSASIQRIDGRQLVHLEFHHELASVAVTLDPAKSMAALDYTLTRDNGKRVSHFSLSDYVQLNGQWIPTSILVEQYTPENDLYRLLNFEHWQLEILEPASLQAKDFAPRFKDDTLIDYLSPICRKPLRYKYRNAVDTDELLEQRLSALTDKRPQNCASVAIEYIARKLKKPLSVAPSTFIDYAGTTTLYDMQQYLGSQGLFAKAIKTTIDRLPSSKDCFALVYLPHISHYLLIESIDERNVWVIDLTSSNFYMSYPRDAFQREWSDGIALIVSNQRIKTSEKTLSDFDLRTTSGGGGFQCTYLVQDHGRTYCAMTPDGTCIGHMEYYVPYYVCDSAPFGECYNNLIVLDRVRLLCRGTADVAELCGVEREVYFFLDWACSGTLPP